MESANAAPPAFYTTAQIAWGSLLGGPFTGAYFLAHNFKAMGRPKQARYCWWVALLLFLVVFKLGGLAYLGTSFYSIGTLVLFSVLAAVVARKMQQPFWEQQAANRKAVSNIQVLITSLLGAGLTLLGIAVLSYGSLFLLLFLYPPSQGHF